MFKSFKARLMGLMVFILLSFWVVNFIQFKMATNAQRAEILSGFNVYSTTIANGINAQFFERYGDIQAFAKNETLVGNNMNDIINTLNELTKIYQIYDAILMVDLNGRYVASNTVTPKGDNYDTALLKQKNYASEPWFKAVVAGEFTEEASKGLTGTYVEDAHIDPVASAATRSEAYGTSFSAPLRDKNGRMIGVITNRANFKWIEYEAQSLYRDLKNRGLASTEITLLKKDGTVLLDYDPTTRGGDINIKRDFSVLGKLNLADLGLPAAKLLVAGQSGQMLARHLRKNIDQLVGYTKVNSDKMVASIGWGTLVRVAESEMYAGIIRSEWIFYTTSSIMLVVFLLVGWAMADRVSKHLSRITNNISEAGTQVSAASSQLSSASQQVSSGSTEAAASLEETVSSVEELSSMVKLNADNAKQAAALSITSTKSAEEGETEIRNLISSMKEISQSSKKIEEIINVIDDIAFQTNLLALNAAVEAARAGEQGKGFAVVAEAVRNLAQRSASAAKDITSLIKDSVSQIETGTHIADSSGNVLKNIVTSVKKVSDLNNEIAAASAEQANGIGQISKAMNELDQSTQTNASTSEEMAASATEMSSQAVALGSLVRELMGFIKGVDTGVQHTGDNVIPMKESFSFGPSSLNAKPIQSVRKTKTAAESIIPFQDEQNRKGKIGTTDGF